ncbi:electron transport complex subunit RsxD [Biformimicrobium ophioploci]|uniref:Ion-translocating oxidoreductase complex subunit D n=1 Tax=Biformimicrobium ophioploci TaxID=3036711 RepID=A0ABQ6LYP8_9GAMM|nr:electron transport complex subunit RsxD [Microbulbifer sp. NKW57]GMG87188.1 RnfABCDGE type electron transport complex subunit D [Microbulbifer sp. NKW57]
MALMHASSPHTAQPQTSANIMQLVLAAMVPGIVALVAYFGVGVLFNLALCGLTALASEALMLKLRGRPIGFYLRDYSALVTAALLAVALPPYCPWWIPVVGTATAIILAKQLYGGLGFNPFNPAMVGYVVLLISFPVEMTLWVAPATVEHGLPDIEEAFSLVFGNYQVDGFTMATPLEIVRHNNSIIMSQLYNEEPVLAKGSIAGAGWEMVNLAFLVGGLYLLYRKVFTWHAPVGMLAALFLLSTVFYDSGSSLSEGSPLLHLFSGATMLGAFFIITDPVSSATSTRGRLYFGIGVGILVFVIRVWGSYPDAVAFAVLLMNFAAPLIDNYTLPRTYGHAAPRRATEKED